MRRFNSRGRSFGFRFRRPMRQATRLWVTQTGSVTEVNAVVTNQELLSPASWLTNQTAGGFQHGRLLHLNLLLSASLAPTAAQNRIFGLTIDEDLSQPDPSGTSYYQGTQPFWFGGIKVNSGTVETPPPYVGWNDFTRVYKLRRKLRSDQRVVLTISPGATGNLLTWSWISRALVEVP